LSRGIESEGQTPSARAEALLAWYDRHARDLPWRVGPAARARGERADPYRVWLSEIMLQQTTVATVGPYFHRFLDRWPTVEALAAAPRDDVLGLWAGLGYYARARNLIRCAQEVANRRGGRFPGDEAGLLDLPGVGPYTAAAIAAIAFDQPATVVDGNVERVISRLHAVETPLPAAKPELRRLAEAATPKARPGDYAQAMMDLGATICTPKRPACALCPLREGCAAFAKGAPDRLPLKTPKQKKPTRYGAAFVVVRPDGAVLLEERPEKGLLGGMLGLPGTDWGEKPDPAAIAAAAPIASDWRQCAAEARHTFSLFHLRLTLMTTQSSKGAGGARRFVDRADLDGAALPTLFRKALKLAL
jgi:A/G-specific adenine glycosylase